MKLSEKINLGYLLFKSKKTPVWLKVMLVAAIAYGVSPIDIIIDYIPLFGIIDDSIILYLAIKTFWTKTSDQHQIIVRSNP